MRKKTPPMSPADIASIAEFEAEFNAPRIIYCNTCGEPHRVRPDDTWRAECAKCHACLIIQRAVLEPRADWRKGVMLLLLTMSVGYFIFQFILKPTKWEIVQVDGQGRDVDGLYLVKKTYLFWGHAQYKLHMDAGGEISYYDDAGRKHTSLPDGMQAPSNSSSDSND